MQVPLVGCGSISIQEPGGLTTHPDVHVAALVDIRLENAHARQDEFGPKDAEISTNLDAMLAKRRPDIVVDCTLPATRSEITRTLVDVADAKRMDRGAEPPENAGLVRDILPAFRPPVQYFLGSFRKGWDEVRARVMRK